MATERSTRRRRGTSVALLLGGPIVALAVLAPAELVAIVRGAGSPPQAPTVVPSLEDGASVRDPEDVQVVTAVPMGPGDAGDAGRWGRPAQHPTGSTTSGPHVEELRGGWRVEAGAEEAAALGVIAVRDWLRAQVGEGQGAGMIGADVTVTLEAVERPGASAAVVTVLAVQGDAVERLAIPILFRDAGPVVAGTPWRLPPPSADVEPLVGTAIGDEVLLGAARDALERVGIPGTRLVQLEVTDGWPFIARLDDPTGGHPWLRWHLDRFVVTGLPLARAEERSWEHQGEKGESDG